MGKALEKLTPEERKKLAEKLKEQASKGGAQSDPQAMKDLAEDLSTPEGQKKLEDELKEHGRRRTTSQASPRAEGSRRRGSRAPTGPRATSTGRARRAGPGQQPGPGEGQGSEGNGPGNGHMPIPHPGQRQRRRQAATARVAPAAIITTPGPARTTADAGPLGAGHAPQPRERPHEPRARHARQHDRLDARQERAARRTCAAPALCAAGPGEIDGVERSDVPEEYREQVRQYFQP